ncbi:IclR family transcriptional regulator [Agromyces archimandritae]|uniref:IclR family transcriptional regulator n=1 Tax=Agromyces archimandritae TaxID=2781962 RepID=A0A975FPJ2_9MICO|nr:IclR family transcriptional regulator [Agromyces archimandritae]
MQILRAFLRPTRHMTVEELVRRTDLPKTTVHRLVAELIRLGMLERGPSGLQLGTVVFELGEAAPQSRSLRQAARRTLTDLSHATNQNVGLAVLDGGEVVYLDTYIGRDAPQIPQRGGMRWPAHASCSGKALLAFADDDVADEALARPRRTLTDFTITGDDELRTELEEIRRRGAAFDRQESFLTVSGVAVPVFDANGDVVAAVSISGLSGRINLPRFDIALKAAALTISRAYAAA